MPCKGCTTQDNCRMDAIKRIEARFKAENIDTSIIPTLVESHCNNAGSGGGGCCANKQQQGGATTATMTTASAAAMNAQPATAPGQLAAVSSAIDNNTTASTSGSGQDSSSPPARNAITGKQNLGVGGGGKSSLDSGGSGGGGGCCWLVNRRCKPKRPWRPSPANEGERKERVDDALFTLQAIIGVLLLYGAIVYALSSPPTVDVSAYPRV